MRAYIAGPLFNEGERWFNERIDKCARDSGFSTYLPHRDGELITNQEDIGSVFESDLAQLQEVDLGIADLNGLSVDSGTAWELEFACASGKHLIRVHTDSRLHSSFADVNPMILLSLLGGLKPSPSGDDFSTAGTSANSHTVVVPNSGLTFSCI